AVIASAMSANAVELVTISGASNIIGLGAAASRGRNPRASVRSVASTSGGGSWTPSAADARAGVGQDDRLEGRSPIALAARGSTGRKGEMFSEPIVFPCQLTVTEPYGHLLTKT